LGTLVDFNVIKEGALNEKYKVNTDTGSFFVKEIKENNNGMPLAYICNVEHYMKSKGIPAVSVIKTSNGSPWLDFGDSKYLVYPYLEGDKSHKYSSEQYESMGIMLGRMHKVGQGDVPPEFFHNSFSKLSKEDGLLK
jgi:Ser/Thr protein kinase RdoA (MazF antagonist)